MLLQCRGVVRYRIEVSAGILLILNEFLKKQVRTWYNSKTSSMSACFIQRYQTLNRMPALLCCSLIYMPPPTGSLSKAMMPRSK
mmetsp:Transcript_5089/g.9209  ORF Transcript_5089/g.9209 Transcript_5089/m.9209 type:complete len:84 (+) Transcript_5089:379-630(+)